MKTTATDASPKRIMVLGASCDIGIAICHTLLMQGDMVIATVRSEQAKQKLMQSITALREGLTSSPPVTNCPCEKDNTQLHILTFSLEANTHDSEAAEELIDKLPDEVHGAVDCMQEELEGYFSSITSENIISYTHTNITARAILLQKLTRHMLAHRKQIKRGRLLFLSSTAASLPAKGQGIYAATKQASEALYRSVGIELGARGITTCSLRAGYVSGGRGKRFLATHPEHLQRVPTQQAICPQEIAATVAFLLSEAAHTINATTITQDGGLTACK